jgi:hypothetical protein
MRTVSKKQNRKANLSKIKRNLFVEWKNSENIHWEEFLQQEMQQSEQRLFDFANKYEILHPIAINAEAVY